MKILSFYAALPLLFINLWAASPAVNDVTLPEGVFPELGGILKQAVRQSPRMLNRALDLEIAENSRIQARAALLPSASAYISLNKSRDRQEYIYSPTNSSQASYNVTTTPFAVSMSQPLYHWGALRNAAQIGEISASIAKGQYRDGYRLFAQTLRADYLRLILQKLTVKRAAFYLEFSKNQLVLEEARLVKKVISEAQIFLVRLAAEQAQIASERAQFDFEMAKASFARLSGTGMLEDAAIPDALPVINYNAGTFDLLLAGFLGQKDLPTAEALTARKQLEIEKLNYAIYKTRLRPKANANIGISQSVQHNLYGTIDSYSVTSLYAGISINWSIFDGRDPGALVRSSLARRRQMEADYAGLSASLAQQAQTQVKQLNFSARTMSITDRAAVAAVGRVKYQQDEFARGVVSEADVSQAQIALFDAQLNAYNGRMEYLGRTGDFLGTVVEDPVVANISDK